MQLLEQLESIGVLQLEVDPKHNDLKEGMEDAPGLGLEHGRDQVSWEEGGVCECECECECVGCGWEGLREGVAYIESSLCQARRVACCRSPGGMG